MLRIADEVESTKLALKEYLGRAPAQAPMLAPIQVVCQSLCSPIGTAHDLLEIRYDVAIGRLHRP